MKRRFARPEYMDVLDRYRETEQIKVLTGVRRCGKSTLLDLYIDRLENDGVPASNIIRHRFDEFGISLGYTAQELQESLALAFEKTAPGAVYVFLDEIQMVDGWERVVRGLHTRENTDVYITGSNAYFLSSDLATFLAGRYIEIPVYPLSFKEYVSFCAQARSDAEPLRGLFSDYLRYGGMPSLFSLRDADQTDFARELSAIYDSIILGDVAKRFEIRDYDLLSKLVAYAFSTSGNLFSTQAIVNYLKSAGAKTSIQTIDSYLYALEQALILHSAKQVGLQGKELLRPLRKLYPVDTGLRNLSIGFSVKDLGFQLENVVYIELLRRGYDVSVGAVGKAELDFVAVRNDEKVYIQVCERIEADDVRKREVAPLLEVRDAYPKIVLTTDQLHTGVTPEGVRIIDIVEWLTMAAIPPRVTS